MKNALGFLVLSTILLPIRAQEHPATAQPSLTPALSNTSRSQTANYHPLKPGMLCKSEDGKLEGMLVQHTAPELKNADLFADPDFLLTTMILMGQLMPEWGIFDKEPDAGGKLLAIGYGVAKGTEGTVFRAVSYSSFGSPKYTFIEGATYAVIPKARGVDKSVLGLRRLPQEQKTKQVAESPKDNKPEQKPSVQRTSADAEVSLPAKWSKYSDELSGRLEVRVKNPNPFSVRVGLRTGGKGKDFVVPADGTKSATVPPGRYEIYFQYSTDPKGIYQGDSFTLENNGVEISIVKVSDGNYGIRKVE